ncbi:hypothetical protein [Prosthecobacter sp.]|uniref:hypothetical protein n=1 Tax=Prosthecobacter sp. TaxID=1965333 RepID=UPI002ABB25C5|nr:hypothetical protein [Prosthecobacter sp.]MDZ4401780.1 hypothetical protein [Prosthecobacter sp.]
MNKLLLSCLASASLLSLSSCETYDDDDDHRHHGGTTTTTTTEETTLSNPLTRTPLSTTVETQTTRSY